MPIESIPIIKYGILVMTALINEIYTDGEFRRATMLLAVSVGLKWAVLSIMTWWGLILFIPEVSSIDIVIQLGIHMVQLLAGTGSLYLIGRKIYRSLKREEK
jgi:hypothetical protein